MADPGPQCRPGAGGQDPGWPRVRGVGGVTEHSGSGGLAQEDGLGDFNPGLGASGFFTSETSISLSVDQAHSSPISHQLVSRMRWVSIRRVVVTLV